MKTILILFTILITTTTKAQFETFLPIDAQMWIVEHDANGPPEAYYLFDVDDNKTYDGVVYNKLLRTRIKEVGTPDTSITTIGYFNQQDGVITCYDTITNEVLPYFNLNAVVGDTISNPVYYGAPDPDYAKFRKMVVDSMGDTLISGITLKKFWMDFLPYESIDEFAFFWNSNIFIEGIGFLGYPLQWFNAGGFDGKYPGELRCYEDTILGLVKFVDEECDYLMTTIENSNLLNLSIYPNPANEILNIQLQQPLAINHIDIIGLNGICSTTFYPRNNSTISIPIKNLTSGIYSIVIYNNNNSTTTSQFIKL